MYLHFRVWWTVLKFTKQLSNYKTMKRVRFLEVLLDFHERYGLYYSTFFLDYIVSLNISLHFYWLNWVQGKKLYSGLYTVTYSINGHFIRTSFNLKRYVIHLEKKNLLNSIPAFYLPLHICPFCILISLDRHWSLCLLPQNSLYSSSCVWDS